MVETVVRRTDGYLVSRVVSAEPCPVGDAGPALRVSAGATAPAETPQSQARRAAITARLRRRADEALRQPGLFGTPRAREGARSGKAVDQAAADTERGGTTTVTTRLVVALPPRDCW